MLPWRVIFGFAHCLAVLLPVVLVDSLVCLTGFVGGMNLSWVQFLGGSHFH